MIRVPLFPGYVFVRTDLEPARHLEIVKTAGAVRLIGYGDGPVSVPAENIESLKIMVASELPVATGSRFREGSRIIVTNGPFAGVGGVFLRYGGKNRVVVRIEALGQFAAVEVAEEDIEPAPQIIS